MTSNPPSGPKLIELTPEELQTKKLGSHNLQAAVEALHRDGLVVLKNAVDVDHLDKLNALDVDFDFPRVPFGYCVNINLVDVTPENGSTEVWLGSHADTDVGVLDTEEYQIRPSLQRERRKTRPPIQPSLPKGSLIIRDFHLWHAGMPNRTDDPRVMLVTVQFPSWYRSELKMKLPRAVKGKVERGDVAPAVEWVDEGYDYLQGAHDHEFSLLP